MKTKIPADIKKFVKILNKVCNDMGGNCNNDNNGNNGNNGNSNNNGDNATLYYVQRLLKILWVNEFPQNYSLQKLDNAQLNKKCEDIFDQIKPEYFTQITLLNLFASKMEYTMDVLSGLILASNDIAQVNQIYSSGNLKNINPIKSPSIIIPADLYEALFADWVMPRKDKTAIILLSMLKADEGRRLPRFIMWDILGYLTPEYYKGMDIVRMYV
jgi:hypothetical protein